MIIHTNAPVNQTFYIVDRDDVPETIPNGSYKASMKESPDDVAAILTFVTGGGVGLGTITWTSIIVDGAPVDALVLTGAQSLVVNLKPGAYYFDVLRTDDPDWFFDDIVEVIKGITAP
jgi:hypothetical protein